MRALPASARGHPSSFDGSTRGTVIKAVELVGTSPRLFAPILIRGEFRKEDVPPGTEVWTLEDV